MEPRSRESLRRWPGLWNVRQAVGPSSCWAARIAMQSGVRGFCCAIVVMAMVACDRPPIPPDPEFLRRRLTEDRFTPSPARDVASDSAEPGTRPKVEVTAKVFGIGWSEYYTYLRILDDGHAEGEVVELGLREILQVQHVSGRLSRGTLDRLARILEDPGFPPPRRPPPTNFVADGGTLWDVVWIRDTGDVRAVVVWANLDPLIGSIHGREPSVLDLVCVIAKAKSEVTGAPPEFGDCRAAE